MSFLSFRSRSVTALLAGTVLLSSCSSTTILRSTPAGARVFIDGQAVGTTPYQYSDTKIVGSVTSVRLEKDGYKPLDTSFSRDEQPDAGAIVGGIFFFVPYLWVMKYQPVHSYELEPLAGTLPAAPLASPGMSGNPSAPARVVTKSRADRLRENKKLLDEKILTEKEYEQEKQRILAEPE